MYIFASLASALQFGFSYVDFDADYNYAIVEKTYYTCKGSKNNRLQKARAFARMEEENQND